MIFYFFQLFFPQQRGIFLGHEGALSGDGIEEALLLQLVVGAFGGNDADPKILGKSPDGGQRLIFCQRAGDDLLLQLGIDLLVNRCAAFVI